MKPADGPASAAPGDAGKGSGTGASPVPGSGGEGALSDLESPATSLIESQPKDWKNGRLVAARGISLKTRRPEFTMLAQITASPRSPIVSIWFNRDGICTNAKIEMSSGYPEIDGPILDSLFRWRATGKQIDELKPGETVRVQLRLLL
ncbi:MAG: hypothetical protein JNK53_06515 [Phycisphaerae bacterium]|nr:hypothetical protein [Phycisphaerae bacterium]